MKQAVRFREGSEDLKGKRVAVAGLGAVGWHMCEYLLEEEIKLLISDIDDARVRDFIARHPGRDISALPVADFLESDVDILCPCAIGGIIDEEIIPKIRARYIWGSANNQLRASSQEEEIRLSKLLEARGICFQAEWWHNTAGVICGVEEYLYNGTPETLRKKIEEILPSNTWKNLNKAKELGITPTECAYRTCEAAIYG